MTARVHFVGAGPGAADLVTVRGLRMIASSPVCLYAGSLVPRELLDDCPPGARLVDTAGLTLDEIITEMAGAHAAGLDVARLHSGDPSVFSAMAEQMRRLDALGIPYDVVPGVPAFAAAAASLKRELTVPGVGQSIILTRTSARATPMPEGEELATLGASRATMVLHLAVQRIEAVVTELLLLRRRLPGGGGGPGEPGRRGDPAGHPGRRRRAGQSRRGTAHGRDRGRAGADGLGVPRQPPLLGGQVPGLTGDNPLRGAKVSGR